MYLARLDGAGRLRVPDPELAAAQFLRPFKEVLVWPRPLGVSRLLASPPAMAGIEAHL